MAAWKRGQCFQEHSPVWLLLGNCLRIPAVFAKDLVKLLSGSFQSSSLCFSPFGLQQGGLKAAGTPQQINVWTGEAPGLTGNNEIKKAPLREIKVRQGELHSECKHRQRRGLESWPVTAASGGFIHECHRGNGHIRKPGRGSRAGADALQCDLKTAFGTCLKYLPEDSSQQSWLRSSQTVDTTIFDSMKEQVRRPLPPWHLTYLTKSIVLLLTESFCTKRSRNH